MEGFLSDRLSMVASLVRGHDVLADIGTDHAYLPVYLVREGRIRGALAMDVNRGPLLRARENTERFGLGGKIECRLSDGLAALRPGEAQSIVIAGMGGALTERILQEGKSKLEGAFELVLQPQSEIFRVRRWLLENGYVIEDEEMVKDAGKFYQAMRAVPGKPGEKTSRDPEDDAELYYGPVLLRKKHPVLLAYLEWEKGIREGILRDLDKSGSADEARREELRIVLGRNRRAAERIRENPPRNGGEG